MGTIPAFTRGNISTIWASIKPNCGRTTWRNWKLPEKAANPATNPNRRAAAEAAAAGTIERLPNFAATGFLSRKAAAALQFFKSGRTPAIGLKCPMLPALADFRSQPYFYTIAGVNDEY